MGTQWRYTTPKELHDLVKSSKVAGKDYVVVDVRDDDFVGGNVKGCLRAPFQQYENNVKELVAKLSDIPTVVFHCALSQVRGPKSARIYAETRDAIVADDSQPSKQQEVLVLQGGFAALQAAYKDDDVLIENWNKSVWENEFW
ncbi:hypothetical protein M422DRAFT_24536 [Sphaerobolus stellatus SS14]|nr:hypothetical protein M422DRAFT_24536 [Sphaerobolus stellatus SS14]